MAWKDKFAEQFNIKKENDKVLKLIIGQQPYKQKFERIVEKKTEIIEFRVIYNKNRYKYFGHIAFFVNNWIKIQDSMEMIFNLLFKKNAINALAFLKINNISPEMFAEYLYEQHRMLLVNRFNLIKEDGKWIRESNWQKIISLIKKETEFKPLVLIIGGNKNTKKIEQLCNYDVCLHPSGYNLNNNPSKYYSTWYEFDNSKLLNKSKGFLSNFHIVNN